MDEIHITGDLVTLRSVQVLKQITVEDFQNSLLSSAGIRTPILPDGVVFYAAKDKKKLYVRCRRPGTVTLNWKVLKKDDATRQSTLKLPWVWMFHSCTGQAFDELRIFCSAERIEGSDETLCRLPMKNLYDNCSVCLGSDLKFSLAGRMSGKLARVEDHFWGSVFNGDLDAHFRQSCPGWLGGAAAGDDEDPWETWERLSASEDFDPCRKEWAPFRKWGEIADSILGGAR